MYPYKLYRRRWTVLALFSLISMTNEVIWISLSSITSIVQEYYRVDAIAVNWLSMIYMLLYVLVVISSYILDKYGLRFTIIVGALLNAMGSCLRAIGANRDGFPLAFLGNTSAALAQCFILFVPPRLAAVWFGDHERATASAIGVLMNMFGVALGFLMGGTMVPSSKNMDCDVKQGMHVLLLSQAIFCSILAFVSLVVIKNAPLTPPSRSQELVLRLKYQPCFNDLNTNGENAHLMETDRGLPDSDEKNEEQKQAIKQQETLLDHDTTNLKIDENKSENHCTTYTHVPAFGESILILGKDKSFHLICQAYGFYFGLFAAYNTILNQMVISRYPGKEKEIGYMGFAAVNCGLFAIFFSGVWLDRTRRYKSLSVAIFTACAVTMVIFTLLLKYHDNFIILFISFCAFGFFSYPYMSAGLEHVAEVTYPVPEGTTSGILLLVGNIYGIILTYIVGAAIDNGGGDLGGYLMAACYVIGTLLVLINSAPLKRSEADKLHH
ncbi:uncharacterized MFS-type transporter C09D4.1-like [Rhopilema esculentum]|uniref:uncharacterized MFS-type transporter C09D4.1-like n=1 Tax=Rhopilema esculentum TaxID=499914 RepID=UPI0031DDCD51|eukprot:gene9026-16671_t